ncbi:hypothetical protein HY486_00995 [Candidatus Woesearchaeota archaeon]|nr:hypothetical protein [Candidatus Woesearchaeota archaeon]
MASTRGAKICFYVTDAGPATALLPVMLALCKNNQITVYADEEGKGRNVLEASEARLTSANIPFRTISKDNMVMAANNEQKLIDRAQLLVTGTTPRQKNHYGIETNLWQILPSVALLDKYTATESQARFADAHGLRILPKRILLPNVMAQNRMKAEGFPTEKMRITGRPDHDGIAERASKATSFFDEYELPVFLSGEQATIDRYGIGNSEILEIISNSLPIHNAMRVFAHPKDEKTMWDEYSRKLNSMDAGVLDRELKGDEAVFRISSEGYGLFTFSGIGETGTLAGKLMISIQPKMDPAKDDVITNILGVTPVGFNEKDLTFFMNQLMEKCPHGELSFREFYANARTLYKADGKATQRTIDAIAEEIEAEPGGGLLLPKISKI